MLISAGPGLTQASLPAPSLHLQRENQRLPNGEKLKATLTQAEPWGIGDKQGKGAARLSYSIDTPWLLVTTLESVFKKLCTSSAQAVKAATLRAARQLCSQRDGGNPCPMQNRDCLIMEVYFPTAAVAGDVLHSTRGDCSQKTHQWQLSLSQQSYVGMGCAQSVRDFSLAEAPRDEQQQNRKCWLKVTQLSVFLTCSPELGSCLILFWFVWLLVLFYSFWKGA